MKLFRQIVGEGDPLIIIHGLFGASGNWQSLVKNHFSTRYRTVALDLRNHGRSPHADQGSIAVMAEDVLELMADEGIERAHVLGHSMGGKVAMHLALFHSHAVDKLIVADIVPRGYPRRHDSIFAALKSLDLSSFNSRSEIDKALTPQIPEFGVRQFLLKGLVHHAGTYAWGMNLDAIEANYDSVIAEIEAWEPFEEDTLFLRGSESNYVQDADLMSIRALFPFAELQTIEGAGHWLHAEKPEEFARICMEFLG